jgi:hypothetical protein
MSIDGTLGVLSRASSKKATGEQYLDEVAHSHAVHEATMLEKQLLGQGQDAISKAHYAASWDAATSSGISTLQRNGVKISVRVGVI